ncbi:MAG: hypothetical protein IAG13_10975 [Deltaproteobacteria bacterium]|nr:hypothetical protein [Nannocystaceae bacterium]
MPSLPHELLVDMMREHPQVVLDLSREVVATLFPGELEVTATAATLREITPPE